MRIMRIFSVVAVILLAAVLAGCGDSTKKVNVRLVNNTGLPFHLLIDREKFSPDNKVNPGGKRTMSADIPEKNNELAIVMKVSAGQNGEVAKSKEFKEKVTFQQGFDIIFTWNGSDISFQYKKP